MTALAVVATVAIAALQLPHPGTAVSHGAGPSVAVVAPHSARPLTGDEPIAPAPGVTSAPTAPAPAVPAPAVPPAAPATLDYVVQSNDSMSAISARYHEGLGRMELDNPRPNADIIRAGEHLLVRPGADGPLAMQAVASRHQLVARPAAAPMPQAAGSVPDMIRSIFGADADWGLRIAHCESGYNPMAHNRSGASGVFQFMPGTWAGSPWHASSVYNAEANIQAAHWLYQRRGGAPWSCK